MFFYFRYICSIIVMIFTTSALAEEYEKHRFNEHHILNPAAMRNEISSTYKNKGPVAENPSYNSAAGKKEISTTKKIKKVKPLDQYNMAKDVQEISSTVKNKPKHDFYTEAANYMKLADENRLKGWHDVANLYESMAGIKTKAGKLADENRWSEISWDEYNNIEKQVQSLLAQRIESASKY